MEGVMCVVFSMFVYVVISREWIMPLSLQYLLIIIGFV